MKTSLPDPRPRRTLPADHPLATPVAAAVQSIGSGSEAVFVTRIANTVRKLLRRGDEAAVLAAMDETAGPAAMVIAEAVDLAINGAGDDEDVALLARVFLLPVLFVVGGKAPARLSGIVPDMAPISALLKDAGALGGVETFGMSNALGTFEAAAVVSPRRLFELVRGVGAGGPESLVEPAGIEITRADEQVHLRFLAGASVTPADLPGFLERSSQVGRWGMPLSQQLTRQLGEEGLSLLPLPRAPRPWFAALEDGRFARAELAFNLFATAAIRRIRSETGDPSAEISARDDGTIRIDLISPLDPMLRHAHAWPLTAADDVGRVELAIRELLRDCRVQSVTVHPDIRAAEPLVQPGPFNLLRH